MGVLDVSRLSPKVRDVFMLSQTAIQAYDVNAHTWLDDCIKNDKMVRRDVDPDRIFGEKFTACVFALIINAMPGYLIWVVANEKPLAYGLIACCVGFITVSTAVIAIHRRQKIRGMRRSGAAWRKSINKFIDAAKKLSNEELKELYTAMYTVGLDAKQSKRNAELSYYRGFDDGFVLGGDDVCHH
jgi:hypothetical protein